MVYLDKWNDVKIKFFAPSVFTEVKASNLSEYYVHIPTYKIINDMRLLGWEVSKAIEVKARKNKGFQKHLVTFFNPDIMIEGEGNDNAFPQILLTNSHDGKNSFKFQAGIFRLICSNGLVVADRVFESIKIIHEGYTFEELKVKITDMVERLPLVVESMNKMKQIKLEEEQIIELAQKMLNARFGDENKVKVIDFNDFISPIRPEDNYNDLWIVFNRIQEKIMNGNFSYVNEKSAKIRKARIIKNFNQDIKINSDMWDVVENYIN
jgi:hypothetical protein